MHDKLKYLLGRTRSGVYFSTKFISALIDPTPIVMQSLAMADEYLETGKTIFYVAGPLTNVDDPGIIERYNQTDKIIQQAGALSYLPHAHGSDPKRNPDLKPDDIYTIDFLWGSVLSDAVVLWGNPPSLGVGVQLGWCDTYQIPTALLQPMDKKLSRLAEAIAQRVTVIRYANGDWQAPLRQFVMQQLKTSLAKDHR